MLDNHQELLKNLKEKMPELEELLKKVSGHWTYEDLIYRFYHHSFKVYWLQGGTKEIVEILKSVAPEGVVFDRFFEQIFQEGTGKEWEPAHNMDWMKHTRPILEAFFHAKYFLEMAVKYGKELNEAPNCLPSGWAGLLCFYGLR
jgi:hypothetical protein